MNKHSYEITGEIVIHTSLQQFTQYMILTDKIVCMHLGGNSMGNDIDCCESLEVHDDLLKVVSEKMPCEEKLYDLAELFKVFGDSTRIRILFVLFESDVCVCDLASILNMTQSAISHQLKILKQAKLVKSRREGKQVFYSLADDHVRFIIAQGIKHIEE